MKIKLSVGQKPYSGYLNIDPAIQIEKDKEKEYKYYPSDIRLLNNYVFDAEATHIVVDHALDYVRHDELTPFLSLLKSKLKHGGSLKLSGLDSLELSKKYLNGEISTKEYNILAYGDGNHPWSFKSGAYTIRFIERTLWGLGLKVVSKKIDGIYFYVEAIRE